MTTIKTYQYSNGSIIPTTVECKTSPGIGLYLVGLTNETVKESILRTATALLSTGYRIPGKKIVINILPQADRNNAPLLDTAIALTIRKTKENIQSDFYVVGELALDGTARKNDIIKEITEYHSKNNPDKILYIPESEDIPESNCIKHFSNLTDLIGKK